MKLFLKYAIITILLVFVVIVVLNSTFSYFMPKPSTDDIAVVTIKDLGVVNSVKHCKGSRNAYRCDILTSKYNLNDIDVTIFPTEMIEKGDNLSYKTKTYEDLGVKQSLNCKNNSCMRVSVCYSWMGCWDK